MKKTLIILPAFALFAAPAIAGDHYRSDGNGGYYSNEEYYRSDSNGGFYTPGGGHQRSDGNGGLYTPGGGHQRSDGNGGWYK